MKQFKSFVHKEFLHIFRDPLTLFIMFLLPIILLMILGKAISMEYKDTTFAVLDESKTELSTRLVEEIANNRYFSYVKSLNNIREVDEVFEKGAAKLVIVIPSDFSSDLVQTGNTDLQILIDATDPNMASTIANYIQVITLQFQQQLQSSNINISYINQEVKMLFNPQMESSYNFVPGLIGMVMLLICALMTSISIAREKEMGTMEILLVSPIKASVIILSKAIPYLAISYVDVLIILGISHWAFDVPIVGNFFVILFLCLIYNITALSLGLVISSLVNTQQIAMMISLIGLLLPSMLLSDLIFPLENMPQFLQIFSMIIPARWFIEALRSVMIEGNTFWDIFKNCAILIGMTVGLLFLCLKTFKNRL